MRATCVFTVSQSVNAVADVFRRSFDCFLDEIGMEVIGRFPQLVVDGLFSYGFAGYAVVVLVSPCPLSGSIRAVLELLVGGVEVTLAVVRNVKPDLNRSSYVPRHVSHSSI
jgi:hypothetical protein